MRAGLSGFAARAALAALALAASACDDPTNDPPPWPAHAEPVRVVGVTGAKHVSVGNDIACAIDGQGDAWCWGATGAYGGSLGDGTRRSEAHAPVRVLGFEGGVDVAAGWGYACGALETGEARCWGANATGQLGDDSFETRDEAVPVVDLTDVVAVAAGWNGACARSVDGAVACWGGAAPEATGPAPSPLFEGGVADVSVDSHACVALDDGSVRCWGDNGLGQLGDGTTERRVEPTPVDGVSSVVAVSAGAYGTCARTGGGDLYCWGHGVVGVDLPEARVPTRVPSLSGIVDASVGSLHACAVSGDGRVYCWGSNDEGQLGDGSFEDHAVPAGVEGIEDAVEVSAGYRVSCAVTGDGAVWCWGSDVFGQCGDG